MALRLEMAGIFYQIVADPIQPGASSKAVGLMNPVTGRRMARTAGLDRVFPEAVSFYNKAFQLLFPEADPNASFLKPYPIWKALHSVEEINFLTAKSASPGFENLISIHRCEEAGLPVVFKDTVAWCRIEEGYHLEPTHYLDSAKAFFTSKNKLQLIHFNPQDLIQEATGWQWNGLHFSQVVSCLGLQCPWVGKDLIPLKGEVYEFSGMESWGEHILKTEKFILPMQNGWVRAGSTYAFDASDENPTEAGLDEICRDLLPEIRQNLTIEKAWAGLRATTQSRQPMVKEIMPNLFGLNGMGTKGISHSPTASLQVMELLAGSRE